MIIVLLSERTFGEGEVSSIQSGSKAWSNGANNHSYYKTIFLSDEPNADVLAIDDETKLLKIVSFGHTYSRKRQIVLILIIFVRLFYQKMDREKMFTFSNVFYFVLSFWFPLRFNQKKTYPLLTALIKFGVRRKNNLSLTWHKDAPPPLVRAKTFATRKYFRQWLSDIDIILWSPAGAICTPAT